MLFYTRYMRRPNKLLDIHIQKKKKYILYLLSAEERKEGCYICKYSTYINIIF